VPAAIAFTLDGRAVQVSDDGCSLLEALRDRLGVRSAKDGCSPQGQCGCCTVLVDGQARVACVTPARRVAGRSVTTVDGLADAPRWGKALCATGGSQCGFCTPGIVVRLSALASKGPPTAAAVEQSLLAHLCRCTGWQTIEEAVPLALADEPPIPRDLALASRRATLEAGTRQVVSPTVALGHGGFADDLAPDDALVAVPAAGGGWAVGETLTEARARAGAVQGRRTSVGLAWPVELPPGPWDRTLRTTWVEPAYLEPDASWCRPGGEPVSPLANGGAFGGKRASDVGAVARRLADEHGRPVRVLFSREYVVRRGPKRPPVAGGVRSDGTGVLRAVRTAGLAERVRAVAPGLVVEEHDVPGPPTSCDIRAAGTAEALVLLAALGEGPDTVTMPNGAVATATVNDDGIRVRVRCGRPLDPVVLRSYCIGAAHMALGWVTSEGLAVDDDGVPHDLTIRSFGVLRAIDTPTIHITVEDDDAEPVNGSDAVFVAVAAAAWRHQQFAPVWPTRRRAR
jgi:xanthine dehydrogenase small subunit